MRLIILFIALFSTVTLAFHTDPRDEFYHHAIIKPTIYTEAAERKDEQVFELLNEDKLTLEFKAFDKQFVLDLHMNKDLLPEHYFEKYEENGKEVFVQPMKEGDGKHCHYQGHVQNKSDSWAAISLCDGISGVIFDGEELYYVEPDSVLKDKHFVFKSSDVKPTNYRCGVDDHEISFENHYFSEMQKHKRAIKVPRPEKEEPKIVEFMFIADNKLFEKYQYNTYTVIERCKKIVNIMNAMYSALNTYIALIGVVVWSNGDKIPVLTAYKQTLNDFLDYRRNTLLRSYPNDNAQLITAIDFDGTAVGRAPVGSICTESRSGGIIMDHSTVAGIVAATSAHELGHNFNMDHDSDYPSCQCYAPNGLCIMGSSIGSEIPSTWSTCSRETMKNTLKIAQASCLLNAPRAIEGPVCGNGFVEGYEQCDCGPKEYCVNSCCNPDTCQLNPNATCATGFCCDLDSCQVKSAQTECRSKRNECDMPEFCDGRSEFCPADEHHPNGRQCGNGQKYCYNGKCSNSHDEQCKLVWGPSAQEADSACYDSNTQGTKSFNCGYDKRGAYSFPCHAQDVRCGRLQCINIGQLQVGSTASITKVRFYQNGQMIQCQSAIIDGGSTDYGLVPDGVKCGPGKICHNQRCVNVYSSP